jgi:hypothetical protein
MNGEDESGSGGFHGATDFPPTGLFGAPFASVISASDSWPPTRLEIEKPNNVLTRIVYERTAKGGSDSMIDYQIAYQRLRTTFALAILGLLVMGGFAKEGAAQILSWGVDTFQAPPDPRWGPITVRDVEAAYRLLRNNHPGAAPELHDLAFQEKLRTRLRSSAPARLPRIQGTLLLSPRLPRA